VKRGMGSDDITGNEKLKYMRYRELTTRKLENVEAQLKTLRFMVNRGEPIQEFIKIIEHTEDILSDVKSLIQQEPLSPGEGFGLQ